MDGVSFSSSERGRWVIFGASNLEQTKQTAQALKKGKLSADYVNSIEEIWQSIKADTPLDIFASSRGA